MRADIEVRDAGSKGKGVFVLRSFQRGEFIFRRRHGRVVSNGDIPLLTADERRHLCELDYRTSAVLLPPGCYLNHSCEPNAMRSGVKVFAWRDIRAGEELAIDYRLNAFGDERWECLCGSASCRGYIVGDFFSLDPERQREYLPYAPAFIRSEHRRRAGAAEAGVPPTRDSPHGRLTTHVAMDTDVPELRRLVNAAYRVLGDMGLNYTGVTQDEAVTRDRMRRGEVRLLKLGGELVGTVKLDLRRPPDEEPHIYLSQLAVEPTHQRRGFGGYLLNFAEERARRLGVRRVRLDTAIPADHLIRWYTAHGYTKVGEVQWPGKTYRSVILEKTV